MSQRDSRLPVLFVVLFILWAFPDPPPSPLGLHTTFDLAIESELEQLQVVNKTNHGDFDPHQNKWLNITGLQEKDGFAWDALEHVKERARQQTIHILGDEDGKKALSGGEGLKLPLYQNISGHVRGSWVRAQLDGQIQRPQLNVSNLLPFDARIRDRPFERNITGISGDLRLEFNEKGDADIEDGVKMQKMKAEVTIADDTSSGNGWRVVLYGTHFVESGQVVLTTTSTKYAGMWALPQLSLHEKLYQASQRSTVERLQKVIEKQKNLEVQMLNPYSAAPDGQPENAYTPNCELVMYLQQHPLQHLQPDGRLLAPTATMVQEMEKELRYREGARPFEAPQLTMSALIFSPDCGFVLESKGPPEYTPEEGNHLRGEKWEVYIRSSIHWTVIFGLLVAAQTYLTITQMKHSSTPSTRSRISIYTVGLKALGDGFIGMAFMLGGMLIDSAFKALLATAFFAFLAVTFIDMQFLLGVWTVQTEERRRLERQQNLSAQETAPATPRQAVQVPIISAAGADTLPVPVTARQAINSGATPIVLPPDGATVEVIGPPQTEAARQRREFGALYGKFYLVLICITFLSLHALSWYPTPRSIYMNLLSFLYLSLWVPQIYRNVMRNCRKALLYRFVIGQSILRLLPIGYFYCFKDNVLWSKPDRTVFVVLVGWVWLQIWALLIQDVLGPRIGAPKHLLPPAYDYHPVLREDEEESRMPIGFTQASSAPSSPVATRPAESKDKNKRIFDCAICMQNIEVPIVPAGAAGQDSTSASMMHNMVARRLYMVTPCRHIFHTKCLEAAMRYRLQCPVCREGLPPL